MKNSFGPWFFCFALIKVEHVEKIKSLVVLSFVSNKLSYKHLVNSIKTKGTLKQLKIDKCKYYLLLDYLD